MRFHPIHLLLALCVGIALFFTGAGQSQAAPVALNGSFKHMAPMLESHITLIQRKGRVRPSKARRPRRGNARRRPGRRPPAVHLPSNRRKYRRNMRRRYWGRRVFGVVLGTAIAVSVAGQVPPRPHASLCWYWVDDKRRVSGYWYYCNEPAY